jgi:hypothetical protein
MGRAILKPSRRRKQSIKEVTTNISPQFLLFPLASTRAEADAAEDSKHHYLSFPLSFSTHTLCFSLSFSPPPRIIQFGNFFLTLKPPIFRL